MFGSDKTGNGPGGTGGPGGSGGPGGHHGDGGSSGLSDGDACDDSPLSRFLCDPTSPWEALARKAEGFWDTLVAWWPLAVLAAVLVAGAGVLAATAVRAARIREAARACWVEVVPPAEVPEGGAGALWQTLAGMVFRTRRFGFGSRHLVAEFVNESGRTRVGLWVPPSMSAASVADAVTRCWPGARTTITRPPQPGDGDGWSAPSGAGRGRLVACAVMPGAGPWTPLIDPGRRASPPAVSKRTDVDPLTGVLGALANRSDGWACVQLVVSPHQLRASDSTGAGGRGVGGPWWARALIGLARLPGHVLLWVFDVMTSHPNTGTSSGGGRSTPQPPSAVPDDPVTAARNRTQVTKRSHGLHLCATLRVAVTAPGPGTGRRTALHAVADGYGLAAPETLLRTRRLAWPHRGVSGRRPGRTRDRFMVTMPEASALWHLPADPARYGIAAVVAHTRAADRDLIRLPRPTRPARQGDDDRRDGGHLLEEGHDHDTAA